MAPAFHGGLARVKLGLPRGLCAIPEAPVGTGPGQVLVTPDGRPLWASNTGGARAGLPSPPAQGRWSWSSVVLFHGKTLHPHGPRHGADSAQAFTVGSARPGHSRSGPLAAKLHPPGPGWSSPGPLPAGTPRRVAQGSRSQPMCRWSGPLASTPVCTAAVCLVAPDRGTAHMAASRERNRRARSLRTAGHARCCDGVPGQPSQQACEVFLPTGRPLAGGGSAEGPQPVAVRSWACSLCSSRCRLGDVQGMLCHDRHALLHTSCASTKPTPRKRAAPVLQPGGTWRPELPPEHHGRGSGSRDLLVALGESPKLCVPSHVDGKQRRPVT